MTPEENAAALSHLMRNAKMTVNQELVDELVEASGGEDALFDSLLEKLLNDELGPPRPELP